MLWTAVALPALTLAGCGNSATNVNNEVVSVGPPEGAQTGEATIVLIRPDVLGVSRDQPFPVDETIQALSITGKLASVEAGWIVLDSSSDGTRRWIPLDAVISIVQMTPREPTGNQGGPATETP